MKVVVDIKVVGRIVGRLGIPGGEVVHMGLLETLVEQELVAVHTEPHIQVAAVVGHKFA